MKNFQTSVLEGSPTVQNSTRDLLIDMFRPIIADLVNDVLKSIPPPEPQDPKPLTVEALAELTNNSVHWVYKHTDEIPGKMKIGKRCYWERSSVIEWMRSHKDGR